MLDLNYILLFIAIASPLILLLRLREWEKEQRLAWASAAVLVLAGTGLAWWVAPGLSGFVGGTLWILFLLLPVSLERQAEKLVSLQNFDAAYKLLLIRRALHPADDSPYHIGTIRALQLARRGGLTAALDLLAKIVHRKTPAGYFAHALTFVLKEDWTGLSEWVAGDRVARSRIPVDVFLRMLGETGNLDELVRQTAFQVQAATGSLRKDNRPRRLVAMTLAFCGRTDALIELLKQYPKTWSKEWEQFWVATAELVEGKAAPAQTRLVKLQSHTKDAILHRSAKHRLGFGEEFAQPPVSESAENVLSLLTASTSMSNLDYQPRKASAVPAVWSLIFLNLLMFGAEYLFGGTTNDAALHLLGALEPDAVLIDHEYWRLITALFLHYGILHLAFNLYALYLLGPALERMIGSVRFALSYLLSGLGSSLGVVLLRLIGLTKENELVGASGCVMGVIGVSAGLLFRHRQTPLAGRRLRNILIVVALQTIFDLLTPQISLTAHLSGFASGVLIGLVISSPRQPLTNI